MMVWLGQQKSRPHSLISPLESITYLYCPPFTNDRRNFKTTKDPTEPIDEEDPSARAFEVFKVSQKDETKDMTEVQEMELWKRTTKLEEIMALATQGNNWRLRAPSPLQLKVERLVRRRRKKSRNPILCESTPRTDTERNKGWADELLRAKAAHGDPGWVLDVSSSKLDSVAHMLSLLTRLCRFELRTNSASGRMILRTDSQCQIRGGTNWQSCTTVMDTTF